MKNAATTATTATTTEKPFASFTNVGWIRPGTFVPIATISPTPDWVRGVTDSHHGNHEILTGTETDCWCMLFVRFGQGDGLPPGDWLIYYRYDDDDGTHDHQLCVAARITQ
jgi:hypothetical protein